MQSSSTHPLQLQRGPVDGGASLLDLRGGRVLPRRPLRPLRLRPPEAARPPHVQAHPETDDLRRLTDNAADAQRCLADWTYTDTDSVYSDNHLS